MTQPEQKIGIKEYIAIFTMMIGTKIADDTPTFFYNTLYNAAWMAPIINFLAVMIPIYLYIKVMSYYKGQNLADIVILLMGKFFGYAVLLLLWIILSVAIILDTSIYTDIIATTYFPTTAYFFILAILLGVCAYLAKKGLEQIGSVAWSLFLYTEVALFIALGLCIGQGKFTFLFPLFGPGEWDVIKGSVTKGSVYADFIYVLLIAPAVKSFGDFKKGTWISMIIIVVSATMALASYVLLFDYPSVQMMKYPFHESIRFVELVFLRNIETLIFPFWLTAVFVRFSVYLYFSAMLFGKLFRIKDFEYIIPSIATLTIFLGMMLPSPIDSLEHPREFILFVSTPFLFFMPIILFILAKWKGAKNNAVQKEQSK